MDIESLRDYCIDIKGVTEDSPFGPEHLAFRIGNKIFLLISLEEYPLKANLKCDPEKAIELREKYPQVQPGYHQNKAHWNTVSFEGLNDEFIKSLINHSYELVYSSLSKKLKLEIQSI